MADKDLSFRSYADLNSLDSLKLKAKDNDPKALETVAKQFESLFVNMLMQNMRKANESLGKDSYFDSNETKFYRDMLDQQLSLSLSEGKGIGISDVLVRQLSPKSRNTESANIQGANEQLGIERQLYEQALDATAKAAVESVAKRNPDKPLQMNELPELRPGDFVDAIRAVEAQLQAESASSDASIAAMTAPSLGETLPGRFSSPEEFVQGIYPLARQAAQQLGLDARVLVAQAALETGWGQSLPHHADGSSTYNLFGIKADQRWGGEAATVDTLEFRDGIAQREKAAFRSYTSFSDSLNDYVSFIRDNGRYQNALANVDSGQAYLQELQLAGYATDPEYASKITGILNGEVLQQALKGLSDT